MKYFIFTALLAASSSLAAPTPLLSLEIYSGHVIPQAAMAAECRLEPVLDSSSQPVGQYKVLGKISRDRSSNDGTWKIETVIDNSISEADLQQVQQWISEAAIGPFKKGVVPCDIGTIKIVTQNYPLLVSQDCGKKIENQHPSALKLINWLRTACSIEGRRH